MADFKTPHSPSGAGVATLPNILKELFGGGNALADSHDNADEASTGTVTEGATSPTELTKGETKLDANAPEDGDITVQTKFDDGDDDYVSNVVGTS